MSHEVNPCGANKVRRHVHYQPRPRRGAPYYPAVNHQQPFPDRQQPSFPPAPLPFNSSGYYHQQQQSASTVPYSHSRVPSYHQRMQYNPMPQHEHAPHHLEYVPKQQGRCIRIIKSKLNANAPEFVLPSSHPASSSFATHGTPARSCFRGNTESSGGRRDIPMCNQGTIPTSPAVPIARNRSKSPDPSYGTPVTIHRDSWRRSKGKSNRSSSWRSKGKGRSGAYNHRAHHNRGQCFSTRRPNGRFTDLGDVLFIEHHTGKLNNFTNVCSDPQILVMQKCASTVEKLPACVHTMILQDCAIDIKKLAADIHTLVVQDCSPNLDHLPWSLRTLVLLRCPSTLDYLPQNLENLVICDSTPSLDRLPDGLWEIALRNYAAYIHGINCLQLLPSGAAVLLMDNNEEPNPTVEELSALLTKIVKCVPLELLGVVASFAVEELHYLHPIADLSRGDWTDTFFEFRIIERQILQAHRVHENKRSWNRGGNKDCLASNNPNTRK